MLAHLSLDRIWVSGILGCNAPTEAASKMTAAQTSLHIRIFLLTVLYLLCNYGKASAPTLHQIVAREFLAIWSLPS